MQSSIIFWKSLRYVKKKALGNYCRYVINTLRNDVFACKCIEKELKGYVSHFKWESGSGFIGYFFSSFFPFTIVYCATKTLQYLTWISLEVASVEYVWVARLRNHQDPRCAWWLFLLNWRVSQIFSVHDAVSVSGIFFMPSLGPHPHKKPPK